MSGDIVERLRAEVVPCPGKGWDGNGVQHCAECCFGTGVVAATADELRIMLLARDALDAIGDLTVERDASRLIISDLSAEVERLRAENERLQRWKAESIILLKQWNQIADDIVARLDADETLGLRRTDIVASELDRLHDSDLANKAEIERLRAEMSTMHRTVVHDCCVQVQSERGLADQLASHLEWALRCVGSLPLELRTTFDARMAEVLAAHKEARRG